MSKLNTLQAFRCVGLTGVVIGHMTFAEEQYAGATLLPVAIKDFNQLFIDWFFVVSGFIMIMVSRGRFQVQREILKFAYARVARIYPPYWVYFFITLAVFLVMPQWFNNTHGEPNLWKSFFLVPDKTLPLVMVAWSLIFELWFYLVFSALLPWPERRLPIFLALWAVVLVAFNALQDWQDYSPVVQIILHPYALEFIAGAALALFFYSPASARLSDRLVWALLGLAALLGVPLIGYLQLFEGHGLARMLVVGVVFGTLVLAAALLERRGLLSPTPALVAVGDMSYTVYLSHLLVLGVIGRAWLWWGGSPQSLLDNLLFTLLMLAAVLCYGWVGYRCFEKPVLDRANAFSKRHFGRRRALAQS